MGEFQTRQSQLRYLIDHINRFPLRRAIFFRKNWRGNEKEKVENRNLNQVSLKQYEVCKPCNKRRYKFMEAILHVR